MAGKPSHSKISTSETSHKAISRCLVLTKNRHNSSSWHCGDSGVCGSAADEDTGGDSNGRGKGNKQQSTKSSGGNGDGNGNDESDDDNDDENEGRQRRRRSVMAGGKTKINNQLKKRQWQRRQ